MSGRESEKILVVLVQMMTAGALVPHELGRIEEEDEDRTARKERQHQQHQLEDEDGEEWRWWRVTHQSQGSYDST